MLSGLLCFILPLAFAQDPADAPVEDAPSEEPMVEEPAGPTYAATVLLTTDGLVLEADGSLLLRRHVTFSIPEPPEPVEGEEREEDDVDDDTDLPEPEVVTVRLRHAHGPTGDMQFGLPMPNVEAVAGAHAEADSDADTDVEPDTDADTEVAEPVVMMPLPMSANARLVEVPILDTQAELAEIDAEREALRVAIAELEEQQKRDLTTPRYDLDLVEAQLAGAASTPVSGAERGEEQLAYLQAQLQRATAAATLLLDGQPTVDTYLDLEYAELEPGEHTVIIEETLTDARWAAGYLLDTTPSAGMVSSAWVAGLELPLELGFYDVTLAVDWGHGEVTIGESDATTTFIAGRRVHPIVVAELPNVYRNIVSDDGVERRVDITNPFPHALPATVAALGPTTTPIRALDVDDSFRLGLGPASGWRVKKKDSQYDIRVPYAAATPVWLPIDPTGCRIAASGDVLGLEEVDGMNGTAAVITGRGIVSVMCD